MKKKEESGLKKAVEILQKGGVVVFPTDTLYGVGCRMDDKDAVKRVYKIKKRSSQKPTLVLVSSVSMAKRYVKINNIGQKLIKKFWPGPLTIIFQAKNNVPKEIQGEGQALGVRYPDYPPLLKIIKKIGVPILAPSANFQGEHPPKKFKDLDEKFIKMVDFVIKGECKIGKESTIVDCTKTPPKVLREGAIKANQLTG